MWDLVFDWQVAKSHDSYGIIRFRLHEIILNFEIVEIFPLFYGKTSLLNNTLKLNGMSKGFFKRSKIPIQTADKGLQGPSEVESHRQDM